MNSAPLLQAPSGSSKFAPEILRLKREKNVVLLAHYYQESEIQDIADFVGDSLELARAAKQAKEDVILFAGVHFMAEGAKILNPSKQVLIPDLNAGCSLSDSCPPGPFAEFRRQHPEHFVISDINCSAAIKAQSDLICTSSNAVRLVQRVAREFPGRPILFAPERNLGAWVAQQTGIPMTLWQGACMVHETFSEEKILKLKAEYPEAWLIAHPECEPTLLNYADFIGSTSQLLKYVIEHPTRPYIVATEVGILHQMKKKAPTAHLIPAPPLKPCACNECPYMKLNTLEKILRTLQTGEPEIHLPEDVRLKALQPLELMLEWS